MTDSPSPIEEAINDDAATSARGKLGWLSITVAAIFGLFYAYYLWDAISTTVELSSSYTGNGLDTSAVPWGLAIAGLLIMPVVYGLAFVIGRRHNVFGKALIFVIGLAAAAALSLTVIALEGQALTNALLESL